MKIKFWKHKLELFFVYPFFLIISFTLFLTGIILMFSNLSFWPLMLFGLSFVILILFLLLFNKRLLSKIIFSKEGIVLERFKKEIKKIFWSEIIDVDSIPVGKGHFYLSFITRQEQISVDLTKKMYKTIIELCPNLNITTKMNQMHEFLWFHKEDYKK